MKKTVITHSVIEQCRNMYTLIFYAIIKQFIYKTGNGDSLLVTMQSHTNEHIATTLTNHKTN